MQNTPALLAAARSTMMTWPALWLPPLLTSALQLMAGGPYANSAAHTLVLVTSSLGVFVIEAGWLATIRQAQAGKPPTMEDFKAGVNAHWFSLVAGNLAFYMLLAALLVGVFLAGDQTYGRAALEQWVRSLQDLPPERFNEAMRPEKVPQAVQGWLSLFTGWMGAAAATSFVLMLWQPMVVLREVGWPRAWLGSLRLVILRFPQALAVALLHLASVLTCFAVLLSGSPVAALLGLGMLLAVTTYFKIVYTTLVADALTPVIDAHA